MTEKLNPKCFLRQIVRLEKGWSLQELSEEGDIQFQWDTNNYIDILQRFEERSGDKLSEGLKLRQIAAAETPTPCLKCKNLVYEKRETGEYKSKCRIDKILGNEDCIEFKSK